MKRKGSVILILLVTIPALAYAQGPPHPRPARAGPVSAEAARPESLPSEVAQLVSVEKSSMGTISLEIKGMDIIDVLKLLSKQAGLNIVAGKNVRGRVTLFLKDVDPWDAFEIILAANDLAYEKRGDIVTVMTERDYELIHGDKFNIRQDVKILKLRYAKAAEVSKVLSQMKTKIGKVVVDEGSNTIILKDAPEAMVDMIEAIRELDVPTKTKVFSLNYATADTIKEKLANAMSKLGTVEIDERTNKLVVTDIPEKIAEIESLIAEFDEQTKQVLIEAKIVQIDLNDDYQFGVNWDAFFSGINAQLGGNFQAITDTIVPTSSGTASGIAFINDRLDKKGYQFTIKALETLGRTNILSSPRIVATNNEEAKILVGVNQPYATQTSSQSGDNIVNSYQITYLDLGVKLNVTPTINADNFITMKIKPEVSSKTIDYEYGNPVTKVPVVKTSHAETTVMVKAGTTIVIAGLMESRDQEEVDQVPFLGSIPFLGEVFKSRTKGDDEASEKTELVIFITPHIITGDVDSREARSYKSFIRDLEEVGEEGFFRIPVRRGVPEKRGTKRGDEAALMPVEGEDGGVELPDIDYGAFEEPQFETPQAYKENVRRRIHGLISQNLTPFMRGEVYVEFSIAEDGTLQEEPAVLRSTDSALEALVVESVKSTAPFPPFPEGFPLEKRMFKILISYQ